ncbi:MAG: hypothetical protein OXG47_07095 [bacterium]|nr:hypothetical protein [bacterium]
MSEPGNTNGRKEKIEAFIERMPYPENIATKDDIKELTDIVNGHTEQLDALRGYVDRRFDTMAERFDAVLDRLDKIDGRLEQMNGRNPDA